MEQDKLNLGPAPRARKTDPHTSHAAAAKSEWRKTRKQILYVLSREKYIDGLCAYEIADLIKKRRDSISSGLSQMDKNHMKDPLVEVVGKKKSDQTNHSNHIYRLTSRGLLALQKIEYTSMPINNNPDIVGLVADFFTHIRTVAILGTLRNFSYIAMQYHLVPEGEEVMAPLAKLIDVDAEPDEQALMYWDRHCDLDAHDAMHVATISGETKDGITYENIYYHLEIEDEGVDLWRNYAVRGGKILLTPVEKINRGRGYMTKRELTYILEMARLRKLGWLPKPLMITE